MAGAKVAVVEPLGPSMSQTGKPVPCHQCVVDSLREFQKARGEFVAGRMAGGKYLAVAESLAMVALAHIEVVE